MAFKGRGPSVSWEDLGGAKAWLGISLWQAFQMWNAEHRLRNARGFFLGEGARIDGKEG